MAKKRTLETFFSPIPSKKARNSDDGSTPQYNEAANTPASNHATYPFPIPDLPPHICDQMTRAPAAEGREINDRPDLDLLYFQPYIPKGVQRDLFEFLRRELFFYRVQYTIKRGPTETLVNTPRYTTVFGVDSSARFHPDGSLIDAQSGKPIAPLASRYRTCHPRPIPSCLDRLRRATETATGASYNFCLVNYYADGNDSISYHSDDERFLGPDPCIASLSLGAPRDFLMKHKPLLPPAAAAAASSSKPSRPHTFPQPQSPPTKSIPSTPLKLALAGGDMVLMRGPTQSRWLHSIPKRAGANPHPGRINITFRKALTSAGTENYYCYNVGAGGGAKVWKWDEGKGEMGSG